MEVPLLSSITSLHVNHNFTTKPHKTPFRTSTPFPITIKYSNTTTCSKKNNYPSTTNSSFSTNNIFNLSCSYPSFISSSTRTSATSATSTSISPSSASNGYQCHWREVMDAPPQEVNSKPEVIDYYVKTLESVLGSEKEAQMCIYDASCDTHFAFCRDIDEHTSLELARLPEVLSVRPDPNFNSVKKDYNFLNVQLSHLSSSYVGSSPLFSCGNF